MAAIIIAGLVTGSVYGLIGVGLVLTYKTSGIFNFAHGAFATVAAYVFYVIVVDWHLPVGVGIFVGVVVVGLVVGLAFERVASRLVSASLALQIAATVGSLLLIEGLAELIFGPDTITFPTFLPQSTVKVLGTTIGYNEIITFGISVALTLSLTLFLKRSMLGNRMRAVVDNADLVAISGVDPTTVRRVAWVIGCFLVSLSGLLLAPDVGLSASSLTTVVVLGFGAAAVGGFTRLNVTWLGGCAIGICQDLLTRYVSASSIIDNLSPSLPFIILFLVILVYPKRMLRAGPIVRTGAIVSESFVPKRVQAAGGVALLAFLIAVPAFAGFTLTAWSGTLADLILLLSLALLVRMSGQISMCQVTFAAIGAVAFSKLTIGAGLPWLPALIVAGLVCVPIGCVLAIPAIRLSGLYLALATFGFGLLVENVFYQTNVMFGTDNAGILMPAPVVHWLGLSSTSQKSLYYVVLACAVVATLAVVAIDRSRLGRLLRSMSDSAAGLESLGTSVIVTRVVAFAISAFLAGIAGVLIGVVFNDVNGTSFDPNNSLLYLVLIIIAVGTLPWSAVVAAIGIGVIPTYLTGNSVIYWLQVVFGVSALIVAYGLALPAPKRLKAVVQAIPFALPRQARAPARQVLVSAAGAATVELANGARGDSRPSVPLVVGDSRPSVPLVVGDGLRAGPNGSTPSVADVPGQALLEVRKLSVRFGGVVAVDGVDLVARAGTVVGVIGPNGAGKTTTFNACCGLVRPAAGHVLYRGADITDKSPSWRARQGIGRTFQHLALFESMTVEENVRLGRESRMAGANPAHVMFGRPSQSREARLRAADAIELCGLGDVSGRRVETLPTGVRRVVELARCLAGNFDLLLLDEPSAGLDSGEGREFAEIIRRVMAERGCGILLVEHSMELVMGLCSYIYVLDFGELIFEGTAAEVQASPAVQAAYLGLAEVAEVAEAAEAIEVAEASEVAEVSE